MRLTPILVAATIGVFATAAVAQTMNTTDPNSSPGASSTGGKPSKSINRANTADPNSSPGASATGGKPSGMVNRASTADPNSSPKASTTGAGMSKKHHMKKKRKHSM